MAVSIIICIGMLLFAPLVMGVANLEFPDTAKVLELYVSLLGIILLVPVFSPEQDKNIRDLVYTKRMNYASVYLIRLAEALAVMAVLLLGFLLFLRANHCEMNFGRFYPAILGTMLAFGGLGIFSYAITDNLIAGYMLPLVYYAAAIGRGAKLGVCNPFSIYMTGSYIPKFYLAAAGVLLITAGFIIRCRRRT